jgi:uncharacterized protein (DUF2252 family)
MLLIDTTHAQDHDRSDAFRRFAEQRGEGEVMSPPLLLPKEERRLHVRQTLREDHRFRIHNKPEAAGDKFDKLASSALKFFRGTALLFYRDHAGMDGHLPTVFTIGDIHPENFGVMPNEDGAPFFGVNDFDEAFFAPFSYDLKRGAVGFYIVAKQNGLKKKKRKKVVKAFVDGYLDGLESFARDDREKRHQYRLDNSPEIIHDLLEEALESRESFLEDKIDLEKGRFLAGDEIVPNSSERQRFQEIIDRYQEENDVPDTRGGHFEVLDVAIKRGSGTASLGLDRYWVLIDGRTQDHADDVILELKQERPSALHGLAPRSDLVEDDKQSTRVVKSQHVHVMGGDKYYGEVEIDGEGFMVRERSPFKEDIDTEDLDDDELEDYAAICGRTLAQAHARSDEDTGIMEGDAEKRILSSISRDLFAHDVVRFAKKATKRVYKDWKLFKKDHKLGAFEFTSEEGET